MKLPVLGVMALGTLASCAHSAQPMPVTPDAKFECATDQALAVGFHENEPRRTVVMGGADSYYYYVRNAGGGPNDQSMEVIVIERHGPRVTVTAVRGASGDTKFAAQTIRNRCGVPYVR